LFPGFQGFTAVVRKSSIFWDITPCSLVKVKRCIEGTHRLYLHGGKVSKARDLLAAGFMISLDSLIQDENYVFLRNVSLSAEYTALYPRRKNS
jgi:hypothetical protein